MEAVKETSRSTPAWAQNVLDGPEPISTSLIILTYPINASQALLKLANDDPASFMQRWISLYNARSRYALANSDLWDMTRAVGRIADSILENIQIFGETSVDDLEYRYKAHPIWTGLLDAGLCSLCQKIVRTHDFLDEFSLWVLDMMKTMDAIISYCRHLAAQASCRPHDLYAAVRPLTIDLWANCASRRDIFTDSNPVESLIPGMAKSLRSHVRSMLHSSEILLGTEEPRIPTVSTSQSAVLDLVCWYHRDEPWNHNFEILNATAVNPLAKRSKELQQFIEPEIIEVYGAENYLTRLCVTLRDVDFLNYTLLASFLGAQREILRRKAFAPYFVSTGFLHALCKFMEHENDREIPDSMKDFHTLITESTLDILSWVTEEVPITQGAAVLIRECGIFRLIGFNILRFTRTLHVFEMESIVSICRSYERLGQGLALRSGKNMLRKDYQRALRQEWLPVLDAFDKLAVPADPKAAHAMKLVRQGWRNLGKIGAGLIEEKEREECAKRADKLCSWRECRWHTAQPPNPAKTCQGCGQARYCSKQCQSQDWRDGHKLSCRRLKATPHHA
ncbi:hypothetical protein PENSPDRAFT_748335 [Peniophora sp. CONT]|nr:hypothetical protein PENSPDRAFT_748335 [Peniophora sp. CONT]